MTAAPAIALRGLAKSYGGRPVLRDIDLEVEAGESLALLGHNGAGKTTLIKLILGLTRPSAGSRQVLGRAVEDKAFVALRRQIGYLPESVALYDAMTGAEVLRFFARLKGLPPDVATPLLEKVGLAEAAGRRVRTYSKGMRQRLGLAQVLLGEPRLLLLDEPTTGLDPALRQELFEILAGLQTSGATVVISSHALGEIESRVDRLAILAHGRLVACGSLETLRAGAGLPVRLRIAALPGQAASVAEALDGSARLTKVNDRSLDLTCLDGDKMPILRRIAGLGTPVTDVEILPPRLEDLYAHYTRAHDTREEPTP